MPAGINKTEQSYLCSDVEVDNDLVAPYCRQGPAKPAILWEKERQLVK